jgi:hypothetical protein
MAVNISQSTQFEITRLVINSKLGPIDVSGLFEELNIFDSVLVPCMSGNILIKDSIGLSKKLMLDGSEFIDIDISKDKNSQSLNLKRTFRIFKQSDRTNINQTTEAFILHFVSEEMIYSEQQKISQSYTGQYSNIASSVLLNYLKIPKNKIAVFEATKGVHNVVVPLLSPIDTMNWLVKRSVSEKDTADYVFFENKLGFNFVSLNKLYEQPSIFTVNFSTKNLTDSIGSEFLGVTNYNINSSFDVLENTRNGYYSNRFVGFDILTRTLVESNFGQANNYKGTHLNSNSNIFLSRNREGRDAGHMPFSRVSLYPFQLYRNYQGYIKENDTSKSLMIDETHKYIPQRRAILKNLMQRRMTISLPGNFFVSSGFILEIDSHSFSLSSDITEQNDKSVSGKYLVLATRHMITPQKHETHCELVTDSINTGLSYAADGSLDASKYK